MALTFTKLVTTMISIHAPPRRSATFDRFRTIGRFIIFQSTHPREGVRQLSKSSITVEALFQSTHPREGVRPQHIANRELHLLHIGCQTAEKPTVSVIFE